MPLGPLLTVNKCVDRNWFRQKYLDLIFGSNIDLLYLLSMSSREYVTFPWHSVWYCVLLFFLLWILFACVDCSCRVQATCSLPSITFYWNPAPWSFFFVICGVHFFLFDRKISFLMFVTKSFNLPLILIIVVFLKLSMSIEFVLTEYLHLHRPSWR